MRSKAGKRQSLRRRLVTAVASAAVIGLVATGCAAGTGTSSGTDSGSSDSELNIAISSWPSSWDQDYVAFDEVALMLYKNLYPYMLDYGETEADGSAIADTENIIPTWAESFTSDDDKNWTLKIREGETFPSGNPITADDVKWSKDRALAAGANVAGLYEMIGITDPDQIEVVDDYTVVFHQSFASALTPQIQAISLFIYDSKVMESHSTDDDPWAKDWASQNPIDGGYYTIESMTTNQEIVLKANTEYPADNAPAIDAIRLTVVSDSSSAATLLRSGDVDMALGLSSTEIADLSGVDGVKVISAASNETVSIPLNTQSGPLANTTLRQAIAYAIPYDQIISTVWDGEARRPKSVIPIDMPGYTEEGFPYDQDADKAKELLAESGETDVNLELAYDSSDSEAEQIAVIVQSALADIGVTVTPTPLDSSTLGQRREAKDLDMQITTGQEWVNDVQYLGNNELYTGAYLNYSLYSNATVDDLLDKAKTVTDTDKRLEMWQQIQEQVAADVPVIPLGQPNFQLAVRDNVNGFVQPVDGLIRFNTLTLD